MSSSNKSRIVPVVLAGIAVGTAAIDTAQAQIEDIIVTAERREAVLQDVPLAVSALGMEQLDNFQINEAQDLQRHVPSLNMFQNITQPSNLSPSLRGGLQQDASLVTAESPFGIYVDDIYVGRLNGNNVTLSDIERVEVLRGPQGTLYGRNTGYGAIKFVSRTPGREGWFDVAAGGGNYEQLLLKASIGGPLSDDWAASFAAQWNEKDEQYFNLAENVKTGKQENLAVRGKLHFMGSEKFDAVLSVSHSDSENDSAQLVLGVTPADPNSERQFMTDELVFPNGEYTVNTPWGQLQPPPLRDKPQGETKQTITGLTLTYDFSEALTFKSITGYVRVEDFWQTDLSGNSGGQPAFIGSDSAESDQYTQEFQLLGTIDRLNYLLGAYYLHEEAEQQFGWNFVTPLSQSFIDTETDSIAVFGEVNYQITDRLKGTVGVRWTEDDKKLNFRYVRDGGNFFNIVVAPGFFPAVDLMFTEADFDSPSKFDEITPRFALDYALDEVGAMDSGLLYIQAARGFKSGGFSAITLASTEALGVYGPETNWTFEGGLKADWFGGRLRTNLAYFFSDVEDIQQNATVAGSAGFEFPVENTGDAEIQGLEFEISAQPVDGLNLFLTGSLLDGEYTELREDSAPRVAEIELGVDEALPPQLPDFRFDVGFDYTIFVNGNFVRDVAFGMDYYKTDEYITAATNDHLNSGWDQLNGFISVGIAKGWEARFSIKNMTDEANVTSGSRGLGGFIFLPPREYLFQVNYRGDW